MTDTPKAPAPSRCPATEEEIDNALGHDPLDFKHGFYAGVRWAEKLHNITESTKS